MLEIIILAIVQGIAEFLPISSSAHLIIFRDVFNIGEQIGENMALSFDIALHLGTLLAIAIYFFKDFLSMLINGLTKGPKDNNGKIFWFIVVASIPAAIFGLLFEDVIDGVIRGNLLVIAAALAIMGIIIYLVDKKSRQSNNFNSMSFKDAFLIGIAQVFALIPGFSRSGTTIAAGRLMNLNREDSAKFSFYMSAPVVFGAVILTIFKDGTIDIISSNLAIFIIGVLIAFISGLLCIEFLLKYIKKHDFKIFMWYRLILALIVIIWLFI